MSRFSEIMLTIKSNVLDENTIYKSISKVTGSDFGVEDCGNGYFDACGNVNIVLNSDDSIVSKIENELKKYDQNVIITFDVT